MDIRLPTGDPGEYNEAITSGFVLILLKKRDAGKLEAAQMKFLRL
jgi:hypothetical protein